MDNVLGVIAEYNPFHNGHLYHLEESKKLTKSKYSIALISGNFTQRGSTSVVNKWKKAKMAIQNGFDLVIELPLLYSIASAENFADGSIKILDSLEIVNHLSFGAETDNIDILNKISDVLISESDEFKDILSEELKTGLSFPKARENALLKYLNNNEISSDILSSPNNILAIEYLKALKKYKSNIKPIAIKRNEANHNDKKASNNFASSSTIRNMIKDKKIIGIKKLIPNTTYTILQEEIKNKDVVIDLNIFEKEIIYTLRKMSIEDISNLPDVSEGLEFSINEAANSCNNLNDLIESIKSKRYTFTRIQRILLYALLGITKKDMEIAKNTRPYIRVLGFNKNGKKLISEISKKNPELKIITSVKKFIDTNTDINLELLINKDILATNIYNIYCENNFEGNLDFKNRIIE